MSQIVTLACHRLPVPALRPRRRDGPRPALPAGRAGAVPRRHRGAGGRVL